MEEGPNKHIAPEIVSALSMAISSRHNETLPDALEYRISLSGVKINI